MTRCPSMLAVLALTVALWPAPAWASGNRTPEEFFQGMRENLTQRVDTRMIFWVIGGAVALVALLAGLQALLRRQAAPRVLHSPARLQRDIAKLAGISRADLNHLSDLARQQKLSSPLLFLICPSLLEKAMREPPNDGTKP